MYIYTNISHMNIDMNLYREIVCVSNPVKQRLSMKFTWICVKHLKNAAYVTLMHQFSCRFSCCEESFFFFGWWAPLLPWRCPLMMKASQKDAGCTQGCPRQAMLCYSWTTSRTQCKSLDACCHRKKLRRRSLSVLNTKLSPKYRLIFHLPGS